MVHLRVEPLVLHEPLADLGVQPLVLLIPGIRRAALQPRLARGQELVTPVGGPRRRDPQCPRHRLETLAPQQAEYRRALTPGRKPPLPVTLGGRSSRPPGALRRRRFLNLLPHLDTPSARTLSQSSVQENSRAQEEVLEELSLDTSEPVMIDRTLTAAELGSDDVVRLELLIDQTFVPSELGLGDDARELGVSVLTVYVEPI